MKSAEKQIYQFSLEDFHNHASHFLWPVSKKGKRTTDIYGPKCFASSESLNRITSSVRMYLESSTSRLTRFVPTWSVKATKSGYLILKLRLSALRTDGIGSPLLLKTPTDFDATVRSGKKNPKFGDSGSLAQEVYSGFIDQRMWPTPTTGAGLCGGTGNFQQLHRLKNDGVITENERRQMPQGNGGQLNPTWVEWLMGYPENYTEVD